MSFSIIRRLWVWFIVEIRFFWLTFVVIAIALFVALWPPTSEPVIRQTGLVLQLFGICTIIWGISETRALFGHPSFAAKAKSWLGRSPFFNKNIASSTTGCSMAISTGKVRPFVTHRPTDPNPTLEARVDAIEKDVIFINERIKSTNKEMDEGFHKVTEALKSEEQARQTEDSFIRGKLEATGTGGVHISAIGASWLFVGVILSTAGIEIEKLLRCIYT